MAKLMYAVLLLALVCGPVLSQVANPEEPKPTLAKEGTPVDAPTEPSTTVTTAPVPDSTTASSTEPPATTNSTTESTTPTTTESTTSTTTEATTSTTTTAPSPKTTPKPNPIPVEPDVNHWTVMNKTMYCLTVDMAVEVNFTYYTSVDGTTNKTGTYDIPKGVKDVDGLCTEGESTLKVHDKNVTTELDFSLNTTSKQYKLTLSVSFMIGADDYPDAVEQNLTVVMVYKDTVPQGKAYHCNRRQVLNATQFFPEDKDKVFPATVVMAKAQWQAFHDRNEDKYDLAKDCDSNDTPDIVPIAVGCALAGLIVIVLLGYLVGRRRSRGRGQYLSM